MHPFVYQKMIGAVDPHAAPGDVVHVYDRSGRLFGRGLFNPSSQVVVRMLVHGDTATDDEFWCRRLQRAVELRRLLKLDAITNAYRLVHAEGDGLSGLVIERMADCLVLEFFSLGMFLRRRMLADMLSELLGPPAAGSGPAWRIVTRVDDLVARREQIPALAEPAAPQVVTIHEHGIRYRANLTGGHKTGFFCDQRDNRVRFARLCGGARVLDLCAYSGGFGLCAKRLGEAREVTAVELDEDAIGLLRENANLNQTRIDVVQADVFNYLRQLIGLGRQYDTAVLDPPKLARTRAEKDEALVKYNDLNFLAMQAVRPGGILLTCSCSGLVGWGEFIEVVERAAARCGRRLQLFERSGAAPDHPIALDCPESQYLKALWLRVH